MRAMEVARGDIWLIYLDPARGKEQKGTRPALVVSDDRLNQSEAGLVIVVPLTSRDKGIASHVRLDPGQDDVKAASYAACEQIRAISRERLKKKWGAASTGKMAQVERNLKFLLGM
jgi:mRNA interferase MazF